MTAQTFAVDVIIGSGVKNDPYFQATNPLQSREFLACDCADNSRFANKSCRPVFQLKSLLKN